jgi:hypothetical protein
MAFLAGANETQMPARNNKKGAVFTVVIEGDRATLSGSDPAADFPQ